MEVISQPVQFVSVRPFHESIVDAIRRCPSPSSGEILRLLQFIKETTIPKGHDEIIAAIDHYFDFVGAGKWAREIREVKEHLLDQKKAATAKAKEGVNLDELQQETERLLALLKDRQPGLMGWNGFMQERLKNLHKLISQALGK